MGKDVSLLQGALAARYTFKNSDSILLCFEAFNVYKICCRPAVLGNQNRRTGILKF